MQMEKYAKQAIAEGIKHRDEIVVTTDSEIYKQLNQHYNRNNLFQVCYILEIGNFGHQNF
jgi:prospero homeobox 1